MWAALPLVATLTATQITAGATDIHALAFSPDGRTLAVCPSSESLQLYDTAALDKPPRAVTGVRCTADSEISFAPDGATLIATTSGRQTALFTVDVAQAAAAPLGAPLRGERPALSRDRTRVALVEHCRALIYAIADGAGATFAEHGFADDPTSDCISSFAWSPSGALVLAGYGTNHLRLASVGKELAINAQATASKPIRALFSPDGRTLAVASGPRTVELRRAGDLGPVARVPLPFEVQAIAFSLDGKMLAAGGVSLDEDDVRRKQAPPVALLDARSGRKLRTVDGAGPVKLGSAGTLAIAFSRDGKPLAVAGFEGRLIVHRLSSQRR